MQIQSLLKPLAEFEAAIGDLYEWFAEVFATDHEAAFTFYRLATDERAHVSLIEYQRRLVRNNPAAFSEVSADLDELQELSSLATSVRNGPQPPSLEEAVALTFRLEGSAAEYHFRNAMRQANPDTARLLDGLGKADRVHVVALRDFAKGRGLPVPLESER
jgi:rubrerythrin